MKKTQNKTGSDFTNSDAYQVDLCLNSILEKYHISESKIGFFSDFSPLLDILFQNSIESGYIFNDLEQYRNNITTLESSLLILENENSQLKAIIKEKKFFYSFFYNCVKNFTQLVGITFNENDSYSTITTLEEKIKEQINNLNLYIEKNKENENFISTLTKENEELKERTISLEDTVNILHVEKKNFIEQLANLNEKITLLQREVIVKNTGGVNSRSHSELILEFEKLNDQISSFSKNISLSEIMTKSDKLRNSIIYSQLSYLIYRKSLFHLNQGKPISEVLDICFNVFKTNLENRLYNTLPNNFLKDGKEIIETGIKLTYDIYRASPKATLQWSKEGELFDPKKHEFASGREEASLDSIVQFTVRPAYFIEYPINEIKVKMEIWPK